MYNNYNYYPQQNNQQPISYVRPAPMPLKGRPVASLEEARASTIDFDGSIFYFPDMANKCIYTKQINDYANVFSAVFIDVPQGCCMTIGVTNTTTQALLVQNANLIIERVA